ncbi:hypothetical protein ES703_30145 [subsurface metagenome]
MKRTDKILKTIALGTRREILRLLAKKPMTVRELRKKSKKLKNRVSHYKLRNKLVNLNIVKRYRDSGVRGIVYKLSKRKVVIDLKGGKVRVV